MKRAAILALLLAAATAMPTASAAPPSTCGGTTDYARALCAYQRRQFVEAEAAFRRIAEAKEEDPQTIRAIYFLARTDMKLGRFDEASPLFIRIYSLDPAFYRTWNCDYLLGLCRRAAGRD
jgi:TolA-binding protein